MIYLSPPSMTGREAEFVQQAFDSNWIAPLGPNVDGFEREICEYIGMPHALALSSGTAGLHIALRWFGVGPGDIVFCSDLTFSGSCNPICYQFANPVFIDSEPESWNMSPTALEAALTQAKKNGKLPKAVIIVDLYGQSADWDALLPICAQYNVPVIEDAAEALGSKYKGRPCGTFGDVSIFSFNGNKIITTSGGGMIVSHSEEMIRKMRFWSTQAREPAPHYEHKEYGYNYRMSNICAGVGRGQLTGLSEKIEKRRIIRERYRDAFSDLSIRMMPIPTWSESNAWLTVITLADAAPVRYIDILNALAGKQIESRPVWKPMHMQPVFQAMDFYPYSKEKSVGEELFAAGLCLPSGDALTEGELERVLTVITDIFM